MLLKKLINSNRSIILGDNMQKIYGFTGIVKKCAVEENPKSEIDRYQAA